MAEETEMIYLRLKGPLKKSKIKYLILKGALIRLEKVQCNFLLCKKKSAGASSVKTYPVPVVCFFMNPQVIVTICYTVSLTTTMLGEYLGYGFNF